MRSIRWMLASIFASWAIALTRPETKDEDKKPSKIPPSSPTGLAEDGWTVLH
jgi:hypothetical protein